MIWLSELDDCHLNDVGQDFVEMGQLTKMQVDISKGFVVPASHYNDFLSRNSIDDVIVDVVASVEADMASRTIASHFGNSRYTEHEILNLKKHYEKLNKPISLWTQMIDTSTGEPLKSVKPHTVSDIVSFTDFSDAIIGAWQGLWHKEAIEEVRLSDKTPTCLAAVIMVQEQAESENFSKAGGIYFSQLKMKLEPVKESKPDYKTFLSKLTSLFKKT